jgi:hypothetical protein
MGVKLRVAATGLLFVLFYPELILSLAALGSRSEPMIGGITIISPLCQSDTIRAGSIFMAALISVSWCVCPSKNKATASETITTTKRLRLGNTSKDDWRPRRIQSFF